MRLSSSVRLRQGCPLQEESSEGYTADSGDEPSSNSGCSSDVSRRRKRKAGSKAGGKGSKGKASSSPALCQDGSAMSLMFGAVTSFEG